MKRNIVFSPQAWEDLEFFSLNDRRTIKRIFELIRDIQRSPHDGIGKPEALRENLSGFWSRRVDDTNRLVYRVEDDRIDIVQIRYHYGK